MGHHDSCRRQEHAVQRERVDAAQQAQGEALRVGREQVEAEGRLQVQHARDRARAPHHQHDHADHLKQRVGDRRVGGHAEQRREFAFAAQDRCAHPQDQRIDDQEHAEEDRGDHDAHGCELHPRLRLFGRHVGRRRELRRQGRLGVGQLQRRDHYGDDSEGEERGEEAGLLAHALEYSRRLEQDPHQIEDCAHHDLPHERFAFPDGWDGAQYTGIDGRG